MPIRGVTEGEEGPYRRGRRARPASRRARRLVEAIECDDVATVDDAGLNELAGELIASPRPRHGMSGEIEPTVILNLARFGESDEEHAGRQEQYPDIFKLGGSFPLSGRSGFT